MGKHPSSDTGDLPEESELDSETAISGLFSGSLSFPGVQYFNEIMHEEMRPSKIAKFRSRRKPDNES